MNNEKVIPVLTLPAHYLSPDAAPEEKAVYEYYKELLKRIAVGEQVGLILPNIEGFKFELVGVTHVEAKNEQE